MAGLRHQRGKSETQKDDLFIVLTPRYINKDITPDKRRVATVAVLNAI
jgi:hypothetical protein